MNGGGGEGGRKRNTDAEDDCLSKNKWMGE